MAPTYCLARALRLSGPADWPSGQCQAVRTAPRPTTEDSSAHDRTDRLGAAAPPLGRAGLAARRRGGRAGRSPGRGPARLRLRAAGPAGVRGQRRDRGALRGRRVRRPAAGRGARRGRRATVEDVVRPGGRGRARHPRRDARLTRRRGARARRRRRGRRGAVPAGHRRPDPYAGSLPRLERVVAGGPRRRRRRGADGVRAVVRGRRRGRPLGARRGAPRRRRRARRAGPRLRLAAGRGAAARRRRVDPRHVPRPAGPDVPDRRGLRGPVPRRPDRARRRHRLLAAGGDPLARGACGRPRQR